MTLIILLVAGGVIGWIASLIMRTDAQQGILLNIIVGIIGSALGGLVLSPLLGAASTSKGGITLTSVVVSLLGALILLATVNLARRGSAR